MTERGVTVPVGDGAGCSSVANRAGSGVEVASGLARRHPEALKSNDPKISATAVKVKIDLRTSTPPHLAAAMTEYGPESSTIGQRSVGNLNI